MIATWNIANGDWYLVMREYDADDFLASRTNLVKVCIRRRMQRETNFRSYCKLQEMQDKTDGSHHWTIGEPKGRKAPINNPAV